MFVLVGVAILFAVSNNILLHFLKEKKHNAYLFNAIISLIWVVCLLAFNLGWKGASPQTWLYGCLYGLTLSGFIFFKTMAMSNGPIALTALFGCSAFILTTVFNAIYWQEQVGFFEIAGILLMLISVFMINYTPKSVGEQKQKFSLKWKIYCAMFFIFSAATGIIFRFHQTVDKFYTNEMMILSATVSFAILLFIFLLELGIRKKEIKDKIEDDNVNSCISEKVVVAFLAIACGICSCVYNRLNIYNSGTLPSTLFFPIFNGGVVILSFFAGWGLFKEKPTKIQFFGVGLGFLALLMFSRLFGLL